MEPSSPLVVLVHGAWHGAWCFAALQAELDSRGIPSLAVDLPGHGASTAPLGDLHGDAAALTEVLRTVRGPVVLVGHSYGGAVISQAAIPSNVVHLVYLAAFVLDAFAFTAESRVGNAVGARSRPQFLRAVRLTGEYSLLCGALLALLFWFAGGWLIGAITTDPDLRQRAALYLPFAAIVPLPGMPSWLLDGIFVGATRGAAMRNAAVVATALYVALDLALRPWGATGLWAAFVTSYILRALTLSLGLPGLLKTLR